MNAGGSQHKMPLLASSNRSSPHMINSVSSHSSVQHGAVHRNMVVPQQQPFSAKVGPATRRAQHQLASNQPAVQLSRLAHQTPRSTLAGSVVGMAGGRYIISPVQQTPLVQQPAALPGGLIVNQVHVAGGRPQGSILPNQQQQLSQGVWQPHELSIPQVRSDARPHSVDASTMLISRGGLSAYGGLSSGQLAQQGWIVRPQALVQQPHIVFQPGQTGVASFPAGVQIAGVQGGSGEATSGQVGGRRLGLYTAHPTDRS